MKRPNIEDYHQDNTGENLMNRPYNRTRYSNDLEKYIDQLENEYSENNIKTLCLSTLLSKFNTSDKRLVKVESINGEFNGEVTKIEWDFDQWIFFVNGEWYNQSEISPVKN